MLLKITVFWDVVGNFYFEVLYDVRDARNAYRVLMGKPEGKNYLNYALMKD